MEEALYQTKNRASEDPLNFPIKLNNKLAHVLGVVQSSDNQPTQQSYMVYEDLATQVNAELKKLNGVLTTGTGGIQQAGARRERAGHRGAEIRTATLR